MRTSQYRSWARQVQQQTVALLIRKLHPVDYSQNCSAWLLISCLVLAAACRRSLSAVAALWPRSPSRETLREALFATLPAYQELLRRIPMLLKGSLPQGLRKHRHRRRYPMAIDIHIVPYFKRQHIPPPHVRKGKRLPGTAYGHFYATASLLRKGQYYVVALVPYAPGEDLATAVRHLLQQAAKNGFSPRYVLMDRGFWAVKVFRYLQRARCPFLIPAQARGKRPTTPGGPTGTQVFFHQRQTGSYPYRLSDRMRQTTAKLTLVVHRRNHAGRRGRHGRYAWVYGLWRMQPSTIAALRDTYRRRFRIESSYRLLEEARGRTSSRDEGWRLWYVVLAVLLLNRWLELRQQISRGDPTSELRWWNRLLFVLAYLLLIESELASAPIKTVNFPCSNDMELQL